MRKVREMAKAFQIERMISKDEILELYLNLIPLGGGGKNICGVEVAAQYYFSKNAKDLDLAESAFIAGINHSPNRYNVFREDNEDVLERARTRTKTVLAKMKELGKIEDEAEYNAAVEKVEAGLSFKEGNISTARNYSYHTAAAINDIIKLLVEEKGWSREFAESRLFGGGYEIYTTQDSDIQNRMEQEFKESKYITKSKEYKDEDGKPFDSQAAMVIIDHSTGYVVGTVGGLGENVNATRTKQSNSIKEAAGL